MRNTNALRISPTQNKIIKQENPADFIMKSKMKSAGFLHFYKKFNFYTTCVEVGFYHLTNLDRSRILHFRPSWSEVSLPLYANLSGSVILKILPKLDRIFMRNNSCHVGTDFCAVNFSSSNVLTDRENFSAPVDFWLLKF